METPKRLFRYSDLEARGVVRNREQLRNLQRDQGFPPGWMLSPNCRVWDEDVIEAWLQSRREASASVAADNHVAA